MPPFASSKRPMRCAMAPVNAPRSWPNSSLSMRPVGMAAQLILTNVRVPRLLKSWTARATSSFPEPVSPRMSTAESVGATVSTSRSTRWIVFEPNDAALWAKMRRTIAAFLVNEWRKGALEWD